MAIDRNGFDDIIAGFDTFRHLPYYALYEQKSKDLKFAYKGETWEEGRELFIQNMEVIRNTGTSTIYVIKFYEELSNRGNLNITTPYAGSFVFQMAKNLQTSTMPATGNNIQNDQFSQYLLMQLERERDEKENLRQEIEQIKNMMVAHQEEDEEIDEEIDVINGTSESNKELGILGVIGRAGERFPFLQEPLKDFATIISHKMKQFLAPAAQPAGASINGINKDDAMNVEDPSKLLNAHLSTLIKYYTVKEIPTGVLFQDLQAEQQEQLKAHGYRKFTQDMGLLAGLTADSDVFELAIKKLRQMA
jgi:hypothetical protein